MSKRTLREKQSEQSRLRSAYKAWVREQIRDAMGEEPRLKNFWRAIKRCADARRLVMAIADSWVRLAQVNIRWIALRMIQNHCDRMSLRMGGQVLDDPFPGKASAYFICRHILFAEGGMR